MGWAARAWTNYGRLRQQTFPALHKDFWDDGALDRYERPPEVWEASMGPGEILWVPHGT